VLVRTLPQRGMFCPTISIAVLAWPIGMVSRRGVIPRQCAQSSIAVGSEVTMNSSTARQTRTRGGSELKSEVAQTAGTTGNGNSPKSLSIA